MLVTGLQIPWALAFAPDGRLFLTERPGRVRVYMNGQLLAEPALALSDVYTNGESGILGLALHPDFASNHFVYLTYTASGPSGPVGRLMRFRESGNKLAEGVVLLDDVAASGIHNGSRVKFGPDRLLYVTYGDAANPSVAQDVAALNGKVLRFNDDGTSAAGNRFSSPVFTFGHRNPQGLAWHPVTGDLWETEHGQVGNDEINVLDGGNNYGWPVIEGDATRPDMITPRTFFTPSVAPSGAAFYSGNAIPAFRNQLFVATLAATGAAARDDRRHRPPPRRVGRAAAGAQIRPPPRRRQRPRRVSLLLHEQPGWKEHAGRRRRPAAEDSASVTDDE